MYITGEIHIQIQKRSCITSSLFYSFTTHIMLFRFQIIGESGDEVSTETVTSYAAVETDQGYFPNDQVMALASAVLKEAFQFGECDSCDRSFMDIGRSPRKLTHCRECFRS